MGKATKARKAIRSVADYRKRFLPREHEESCREQERSEAPGTGLTRGFLRSVRKRLTK